MALSLLAIVQFLLWTICMAMAGFRSDPTVLSLTPSPLANAVETILEAVWLCWVLVLVAVVVRRAVVVVVVPLL